METNPALFNGELAWNNNLLEWLGSNKIENRPERTARHLGHWILAHPPEKGWIKDNPDTTDGDVW